LNGAGILASPALALCPSSAIVVSLELRSTHVYLLVLCMYAAEGENSGNAARVGHQKKNKQGQNDREDQQVQSTESTGEQSRQR
jgi:hypothetical protein